MAAPMLDQGWIPQDNFGSRLALVRQHYGWNVKQAAEHCGIGTENWRKWERGRSPRGMQDIARQISDRSGVSYAWLMAGDAAVARSRCFSPLSLVSDLDGQMELDFRPAPVLASV